MRKYRVTDLVFRKQGNPIGEMPRIGPPLMRLKPIRGLDHLLEPLLGSMLIMRFGKQAAS